ncbi:hypothetical protein, partial [Streptomyces sp. NPDC001880]
SRPPDTAVARLSARGLHRSADTGLGQTPTFPALPAHPEPIEICAALLGELCGAFVDVVEPLPSLTITVSSVAD